MKIINKILRQLFILLGNVFKIVVVFLKSMMNGQFLTVFKDFARSVMLFNSQVVERFIARNQQNLSIDRRTHFFNISSLQLEKLKNKAHSLHAEIYEKSQRKYSLIIYYDRTLMSSADLDIFLKSVQNIAFQDCFELIIGSREKLDISDLVYQIPGEIGEDRIYEYLVNIAKNEHIILFQGPHHLRTDFLYRIEQVLSLDNHSIDAYFFKSQYENDWSPHESIQIPFVFNQPDLAFILSLKNKLQQYLSFGFNLMVLNMLANLKSVEFVSLPILQSLIINKVQSNDQISSSLTHFYRQKKLEWQAQYNSELSSYQVNPAKDNNLFVHVIVPFKDQKEMTLKCAQSLLRQKKCQIGVSFVDNQSQDFSIAENLKVMGFEVLGYNSNFNFSAINNFAVANSKYQKSAQLILFLNNDVELNEVAISEMTQWMSVEKVGIVGARLHYPNGLLQHGGIELTQTPRGKMSWQHRELQYERRDLKKSNQISICDAVTGACLMIRRDLFLKLKGFDEILYPIAYSDTDLCTRARELGYLCLYTPFAYGTHYEGLSRGIDAIEDFEESSWLYFRSRAARQRFNFTEK